MKNHKKKANFILILLITMFIFLGTGLQIFTEAPSISYQERRTLEPFPKFTIKSLLSTEFMKDLEVHLADSFPFRDFLQRMNIRFSSGLFLKKDFDGYYSAEGHLSKMLYPLEKDQVLLGAEKISEIQKRYLTDMDVYYGVIPDKNYFLAENTPYLSMNYQAFLDILDSRLSELVKIDLFSALELEDYYRTDPHWKQESLEDVLKILGEKMDFKASEVKFNTHTKMEFYGSYHPHVSADLSMDSLNYLTSDAIVHSHVHTLDSGKTGEVYDSEADLTMDPYNFFLGGPAAIQIIENPMGNTEKELILFRDSFGSSLAPLLMNHYDRITLIDLRYVPFEQLENHISFDDQDVLFLYSTEILNRSAMLR